MASQVTFANLFSESRNNVVALITQSNVPDPRVSAAEFRKWIYTRFPDMKSANFKGFPILIVRNSDVDIDEGGSVDGKSKMVFYDIEVEVYTSDRGYGGKDGQGSAQMDTISNNLVKTFNNITNRNTLRGNSMPFSRPTTTAVNTEIIQDELLFTRSILLSFKIR